MMAMNTEFKTINREFKTVKVIVKPVDVLAKGEKPFGQIQVLMLPVKSSPMLLSIINDVTLNSYNQIKSLITHNSQSGTMIPQPVKTLSGNFGYFEIDNNFDYFIVVISENYLQKKFLFTYPDWKDVTITLPDNSNIKDPEVDIGNITNENIVPVNRIDRTIPLITVRLLPSPAYTFDSGMSIIRILVSCKDTNSGVLLPVTDAFLFFVKIENHTEKFIYIGRTDTRGQATLNCNRMSQERIIQINGFTLNAPVGISEQKEFTLVIYDNASKNTKREKITFREFRRNSKEIVIG